MFRIYAFTVPPIIKDLENTRRRFVIHFGKGSNRKLHRFTLNEESDPDETLTPPAEAAQRLPASPPQTETTRILKNSYNGAGYLKQELASNTSKR